MARKFNVTGPYHKGHEGPFVIIVDGRMKKVKVLFASMGFAFALVGDSEEPETIKLSEIYCAEHTGKAMEVWLSLYRDSVAVIRWSKEEAQKWERAGGEDFVETVHLREVED